MNAARTGTSHRLASAAVMTIVLLAPEHSAAQTLFFSSFDQDDTSYFELEFGPPDSQVSFDATLGSPSPGSIRLARSTSTGSAQLISPCLAFAEDRRYTIAAVARAEVIGAACDVGFVVHDDLSCADSPGLVPNPPPGSITGTPDSWVPIETSVAGAELSFPWRRIRFTLSLHPSASPAACNWDNVHITSTQVESIPVGGATSQLLLLFGLVGAALSLLHRRT